MLNLLYVAVSVMLKSNWIQTQTSFIQVEATVFKYQTFMQHFVYKIELLQKYVSSDLLKIRLNLSINVQNVYTDVENG